MAIQPQELFKKIRRIQIQTTHLANDILAGAYRSAFKGKGMEFEEVREYEQGDDIRSIDWNVTARMNRPYVKSFREEREITVVIAVDVSASTYFGSGEHLKSELIAEIAAVLAFSAIKNQDKVALLLFSDKVEKYIPPRKGNRHVLHIIRELLTYKPQQRATNISAALSFLGKVQRRSGIIFLLSDFLSPDFFHAAALATRQFDLVPVAFIDPAEKKFPSMGLVSLQDLETGISHIIDTSRKEAQVKQTKMIENRLAELKKQMEKLGTALCVIDTHLPYLQQLKRYFLLRRKK